MVCFSGEEMVTARGASHARLAESYPLLRLKPQNRL
jgi:hypothetical protein